MKIWRIQIPNSIQIKRVVRIALFWTLISIFLIGFESAVLLENDIIPGWALDGNFWNYILASTITFIFIGLVGGFIIVFIFLPWIRKLSYGRAILYCVISFTVLFLFATIFQIYFIALANTDFERVNIEAWKSIGIFFTSIEAIRYFILWLLILIGTLISIFVSDKYGPGILGNFLLGKYFQPKEEDRIFMFLDLKGSTSIAEQLGEHEYFRFLKNIISDVTSAILNTRGEIYEYVGDEIIISWPLKKGLQNAYCIHCFYEIQKSLQQRHTFYEKEFNIQPVYKAGLHCGRVIAGEIGVIKRDITYTGDVLNTTARIESKCNELGVIILISEQLFELLDNTTQNNVTPVGEVSLRGKEKPMELYTFIK